MKEDKIYKLDPYIYSMKSMSEDSMTSMSKDRDMSEERVRRSRHVRRTYQKNAIFQKIVLEPAKVTQMTDSFVNLSP